MIMQLVHVVTTGLYIADNFKNYVISIVHLFNYL
jgi:hypothetical protein